MNLDRNTLLEADRKILEFRSKQPDSIGRACGAALRALAKQPDTVCVRNDLELKRVAYVLGMALLQSSIITDDETIAARDYAVSLGKDLRVMYRETAAPKDAP